MKKILAGALALLASATMAFAEMSVGAHGIFGFGTNYVGTLDSLSTRLTDSTIKQEVAPNGGFGINARLGTNGPVIFGFQPELNFVFARADKGEFDILPGITAKGSTTYNSLDIPLMLYLGGRIKNKVDISFLIGPQVSFALGKAKSVTEVTGLGKTEAEQEIGVLGFGGVAGLEVGYNITQNHGVMLGYRFGIGAFFGDDLVSDPPTKGSVLYIDAGQITLGYRYTF